MLAGCASPAVEMPKPQVVPVQHRADRCPPGSSQPQAHTAETVLKQPDALDYVGAFVMGLGGRGAVNEVAALSAEAGRRNVTYEAILRRTGDPVLARAAVTNPEIGRVVIPAVFGPGTPPMPGQNSDVRLTHEGC